MSENLPSGAGDAASFKRVAGGFLFRVPGPWPLTARHVLVTEAEKAKIDDCLRATGWRIARGLIYVSAFLIIQATTNSALWFLPLFVAVLMVQAGIFRFYRWRRLAPLVASLPRTNERYSLYELLQSSAAAKSFWELAFLDLASVCLLVAFSIWPFAPPQTDIIIAGQSVVTWAALAICGGLAAYCLLLTILKMLSQWKRA